MVHVISRLGNPVCAVIESIYSECCSVRRSECVTVSVLVQSVSFAGWIHRADDVSVGTSLSGCFRAVASVYFIGDLIVFLMSLF